MLAELAGQPLPDSRQFALTQALQRAASHPEFTPFAIGQLLFNQPLAPCRQTRPYLPPETGIAHAAARFFHQLPIEPVRPLLRDRKRDVLGKSVVVGVGPVGRLILKTQK